LRYTACSMRTSWLLLASLALVAGACQNNIGGDPDAGFIGAEGEGEGEAGEGEGEGEGGCSPDPVIGLVVAVKDRVTQFPICDAVVTINDGAFTETLTPTDANGNCEYSSTPDRIGVFDIVVTHPDYQDGGLSDVEVFTDTCGHAVLRRVEVRLDA
jgi:hypothetical protein